MERPRISRDNQEAPLGLSTYFYNTCGDCLTPGFCSSEVSDSLKISEKGIKSTDCICLREDRGGAVVLVNVLGKVTCIGLWRIFREQHAKELWQVRKAIGHDLAVMERMDKGNGGGTFDALLQQIFVRDTCCRERPFYPSQRSERAPCMAVPLPKAVWGRHWQGRKYGGGRAGV